jgi:hypothetical protein
MIENRRCGIFQCFLSEGPVAVHQIAGIAALRFLHKTQTTDIKSVFLCIIYVQNVGMIYGYARVSTDGQSVEAQVTALTDAGAEKVFREVASGAKTDRIQLRRALDALGPGDVLMVTRLDRLAHSTRDLLNTLAAITGKQADFHSLGDTWADTTTPHGRLMLTVLGVQEGGGEMRP